MKPVMNVHMKIVAFIIICFLQDVINILIFHFNIIIQIKNNENKYWFICDKRAAIICTDHCIYTDYLRDNITSDRTLTSTY